MTITEKTTLTVEEICTLLAQQKITPIEAAQMISAVQSAGNGKTYDVGVSEKGCVSFKRVPGTNGKFGLSMYPVTLQWLFAHREEIEKFMEDNKAKLSWEKPKKEKAEDKKGA